MGLVIAATIAVATGCGSGDDDGSDGASAATELNLLAWEGYTEPDWVEPFEDEHGVSVNVTYIGSDDELLAKLRGGGDERYDFVAANRYLLEPLSEAGLIVPLDESRLTNFENVQPALADAGTRVGDELFGVPYVWGSISMLYDAEAFPEPPKSWQVVFEPGEETCGDVLLDEDAGTTVSLAALYLGYDNPYALTDEQLANIQDLLLGTRECAKAFYSGFGDAANYFASGDVTVGISLGSLITALAEEKGADVKETVPEEGALGWMDTWALTTGGEAKADLAYAWLDYVNTPDVQRQVVETTTFAPVIEDVDLDPKLAETTHADDPGYLETLVPMQNPQPPDSIEKRIDLWNVVKGS